MKVIGLTGGIATGKSVFSSMLRKLGANVIDADQISRGLTAPGGAALPDIRGRFGGGVFGGDGRLDRAALAGIVFGDEMARRALESIIHPLVIIESRAGLESLRQAGAKAAALEAPLLIEAGMDAMCDEVWLTYAPEPVQLARLMERDHLTKEQARARIASQAPFSDKARVADLILPMVGLRVGICAMASRQWARVIES
ncbi:MAG: dephospho-CoA kinase [Oscillospiraceae bacterium]|jgi:dephospho-CoA kinase|nr:dephospho-CoA kinase [Oscillospiraceae bacterium]